MPVTDQDDENYFDREGEPLVRRRGLRLVLSEGAPAGSDEALALQLATERRDDARHVELWGKWLVLDGPIWVADETNKMRYCARELCRRAGASEGDPREAKRLASAKTVHAVEGLARADPRLSATTDQWNRDDFLLNTPGGVEDLPSWRARPQRPDDYLTKLTAVAAAAEGTPSPRWSTFLNRIFAGDAELIAYIQRVAGYCLTGSTTAHAIFFAYGTGANGKSVLMNTLMGVLGDYAVTSPIETFLASDNDRHPTELADLAGARLVCATETEQGRRWAESRLKQLTGGDPIKARFMRQDFFTFRPRFKLLIAGNHKPALRGVDEAMRRRLHLIPFDVTIPPDERDPALGEALKAEWPAILRWAIDGFRLFADEGLNPPPAVTSATDHYLEGEDAIALWMDDRCERAPDAFETSANLYASWRSWSAAAGEYTGSIKRFSQSLESHGVRPIRRATARGFVGLKLLSLLAGGE